MLEDSPDPGVLRSVGQSGPVPQMLAFVASIGRLSVGTFFGPVSRYATDAVLVVGSEVLLDSGWQ